MSNKTLLSDGDSGDEEVQGKEIQDEDIQCVCA